MRLRDYQREFAYVRKTKNPLGFKTTELSRGLRNDQVSLAEIELLLAEGADSNKLFFEALDTRNLNIIKLFLDKGANIAGRDHVGRTCLWYVVKNPEELSADSVGYGKYEEILRLLISRGADVNAKDNKGATALMFYSSISRDRLGYQAPFLSGTLKTLLENGADVNARDNSGRTVLMHAVIADCFRLVDLVLRNGADWKLKDNKGKDVFSYIPPWPDKGIKEKFNELAAKEKLQQMQSE